MRNGEPAPSFIHVSVNTRAGVAALSDLTAEDIDAIVRYWYSSADEYLDFLGIERSLLGSENDTRERFLRAIRTGGAGQQSIAFAIRVNGEFAGYTLLNRYTLEINYSHWHITVPHFRACGISTALYPHRIKTYFEVAPIVRLIHQTPTRNIGVNRMLDRFVPIVETTYIQRPDGVALPGEFHIRYIFREDIPRLF